MSHYFDYDPTLKKNPKILDFIVKNLKIMVVTDKGTFAKYRIDLGTRIFIDTLVDLDIKGKVLDLGSGNGIVGISIKKVFENTKLDFLDINSRCVELTKESLKLNSLEGNVYLSDGFNEIPENKYDYILLNSPISAGKEVCYKMYLDSVTHLEKNGKLIIVIRKDKGALSHKKYLETIFKEVSIINKDKGYLIIESNN